MSRKKVPSQRSQRLENLALDPSAAFLSPEAVRDSTALGIEEKIRILKSWAYDEAEMSVALEEGMPAADRNDIQRRVLLVLEELAGALDLENTGPSKQHGIPSGSNDA